jgi:hypothetical protein
MYKHLLEEKLLCDEIMIHGFYTSVSIFLLSSMPMVERHAQRKGGSIMPRGNNMTMGSNMPGGVPLKPGLAACPGRAACPR